MNDTPRTRYSAACASEISPAVVTMTPPGLTTDHERCSVSPPTVSSTASTSTSTSRTTSSNHGRVVDRFIRTDGAEKGKIVRRSSSDDVRLPPFGKLDSEAAHASCGTLDQYLLSRCEPRVIKQTLPGGQG